MNRVYAGSAASITFTVTTGGTFTSIVRDPLNRKVASSVTEDGGTATLTINSDAWPTGASGIGRLEIRRTSGNSTTVEASERFRVLPGFAPEQATDYTG